MIKTCLQCKTDFTITAADQQFYQKITVPKPQLCPTCRLQRRLAWRNEKTLYQRQCDLCKKVIISIYRADAIFPVYCQPCWWSDQWSPLSYGQKYNEQEDFFMQLQTLRQRVPRVALMNTSSENSEYTNYSGNNKNCYLVFANATGNNENCAYGISLSGCREAFDNLYVYDCELVYNCIDCRSCYRLVNAHYCTQCSDSAFLEDCTNCQNCLGCKGLHNKQYYIFNQRYNKEDYEQKLQDFHLNTAEGQEKFREQWEQFRLTIPNRYMRSVQADNCTGDYISHATDCLNCFDMTETEHCTYVNYGIKKVSDCYDVGYTTQSSLGYECMSLVDSYNCKFCNIVWWNVRDLEYCELCFYTQNCFGSISLRKQQYCILNTQYTAEEYKSITEQIRVTMKNYGEFPAIQQSPFAYTETVAQEYFPQSVVETRLIASLPHETLGCAECFKQFKLIKQELEFYKTMHLPLPGRCFHCRNRQRRQQKGTMQLWVRQCMCVGQNHGHADKCMLNFKTTYAPDRKELVYCAECYSKEVY